MHLFTVDRVKSLAADDAHRLCSATFLQAAILYRQCKDEDSMSETLRALDIAEKLGLAAYQEGCKDLPQRIEVSMKYQGGECLNSVLGNNAASDAS